MKLQNYMTLKEIEATYGVKVDTVRSYITRKLVIPLDKRHKIGNQWFVDRKFAEEKWGGRKWKNM